jgi:hypothetical protein
LGGCLELATQAAQAEGEDNLRDSEDDGVNADHPHQAHCARARKNEQQNAEDDREQAAEDIHPFTRDHTPELDSSHDLENARDERPGGNEIHQDECGYVGPEEGQQSNDDPRHAFQQHCPPAFEVSTGSDAGEHGKDAVHQRKGAKQQNQGLQRLFGSGERHDAEDDGYYATQREHPPVTRNFF